MTEYKKALCKNCYRKLGNMREIIQGTSGTWVHNNPINYDIKCHPFQEWVAEPREEQ